MGSDGLGGQREEVPAADPRRLTSPLPPDVLPRIEAAVADFLAAGHCPGLAWGVVHEGALVLSGGAGVARSGGPVPDRDSVFRIASMTKSFTAAAILHLRDEGRLRLDDPVRSHLPDFAAVALPTADSPDVTIAQLLTMSAGLPTDDPWADRQESMQPAEFTPFLQQGLSFSAAPGTGFAYSNLGYTVLGQVVAALTGRSVADAVRSLLLAPLGLRATVFAVDEVDPAHLVTGYHREAAGWVPEAFDSPGVFSAMAGLFSSVSDLARWIGGFTDAFPPRDAAPAGHPLRRATLRDMQQTHRTLSPGAQEQFAAFGPTGYGYGLFVDERAPGGLVVSHPGGYPGYGSFMCWQRASAFGVVVLGNGRYTPAGALGSRLLSIVVEHAVAVPELAWPETLAAQAVVEGLLVDWDDRAADALFASNVDLDLPRSERRRELREAARAAGFTRPSMNAPTVSTPAGLRWECTGTAGTLEVEISLTPQRPPRVQTLSVTARPPLQR